MKNVTAKTRICIVGGGVAGASLAIRLARQNLRVTIIEKDTFPRHKLCGEFVSPECLEHFESLGVMEDLREIGGDSIRETRFFSPSGKSITVPSKWFSNGKLGALGVSRSEMDYRLLQKAREVGAEVLAATRVVRVDTENDHVNGLWIKNALNETSRIEADLFIDATGRGRVLGKLVEKNGQIKRQRKQIKHIAFKAHLDGVCLEEGVCEIYFFRGGYGGLNYVENGIANHCFIIDSNVAREFGGDADRIMTEVVFRNERAFEAMKNAEKQFDWLAVSVEKFGRQPSTDVENLISIGDAAAFIDPFTGSGMLMALESSEILAESLLDCVLSGDYANVERAKSAYEYDYSSAMKRRLVTCAIMRKFSRSPILIDVFIWGGSLSNSLVSRVTKLTRPIIDSGLIGKKIDG